MKLFIRALLVMTIFITTLSACTKQNAQSKNYFVEPDIIKIYKCNSTQTISKDNKLYSVIVSEMRKRFHKKVEVIDLTLDENNMRTTKQKEFVIEFLFFDNKKSKFDSTEKEYSSLIFPLTGENRRLCFFEQSKNYYSSPIGLLNKSRVLLDLFQ